MSFEQNANKISTLNSRAVGVLEAGEVFQGVGELVAIGYRGVGVSIKSETRSSGVLTMEVSHDNITYGGPTRDVPDSRFAEPKMWVVVEKYFRIKYTNGSTRAADVSIQTTFAKTGEIALSRQLSEDLSDETEAITSKSVLVGRDQFGDWINVKLSTDGRILVESKATQVEQMLRNIVEQQKITNLYLENIWGKGTFKTKDIEE